MVANHTNEAGAVQMHPVPCPVSRQKWGHGSGIDDLEGRGGAILDDRSPVCHAPT